MIIVARRLQRHISFEGTFRLSIVAAVAAAAYTAYEGWQANVQAYNDTLRMVLTYECGGRQSDDALKAALTGPRIDLSKAGCSTQPLWASYIEIVRAREGTLRREKLSGIRMFRLNIEGAAAVTNAGFWFVLVNLLGVAFLCGRTVIRWVQRALKEYLA
jgi:hypothetical protein